MAITRREGHSVRVRTQGETYVHEHTCIIDPCMSPELAATCMRRSAGPVHASTLLLGSALQGSVRPRERAVVAGEEQRKSLPCVRVLYRGVGAVHELGHDMHHSCVRSV